jgi:predicted amidohydrolase
MRAHLVQSDIAWEDKGENFRRVAAMLDGARVERGDLVVLPEMFDTGFSFNLDRTHDGDGRTLEFLRALSRRLGATVQGARTVLGSDGRGRNRATVTGPDGEVLVEYDKIHPFSYGRESRYFSGGESVVTYPWTRGATDAAGACERATVCPAICYDLRFPELFRRGLAMGAEVFAVGANWPAGRAMHRRILLLARAIENQAVVLGVNRVGRDPSLEYAGGTIAIGPKGDVIAELGAEPGVLSVDVDLGGVRAWREEFPAWKDARLL